MLRTPSLIHILFSVWPGSLSCLSVFWKKSCQVRPNSTHQLMLYSFPPRDLQPVSLCFSKHNWIIAFLIGNCINMKNKHCQKIRKLLKIIFDELVQVNVKTKVYFNLFFAKYQLSQMAWEKKYKTMTPFNHLALSLLLCY